MKYVWTILGALILFSMDGAAADEAQLQKGEKSTGIGVGTVMARASANRALKHWRPNTRVPSRRFWINEQI